MNMPAQAYPDQSMEKPSPEPVDKFLNEELSKRAEYHANEASWYEEAARRHRAAEQACRSGVSALEVDFAGTAPQPR